MKKYGIESEEAMKMLLECPKLISVDLHTFIKEVVFLFELYHKMSQKDVIKIFRKFPYMMCLTPRKIQRFLGEFKKYRLTP